MSGNIIGELRKEVEPITRRALSTRSVLNPSIDVLKRFVAYEMFIAPHDFRALAAMAQKARDNDELEFISGLIGEGPKWTRLLSSAARRLGVEYRPEDLDPVAVGYSMLLSWIAVSGTMGDLAVLVGVNFDTFCINTTRLAEWAEANGVEGLDFMKCRGLTEERLRAAEAIAERYLDWGRYRFVARATQTYEALFWEALGQ